MDRRVTVRKLDLAGNEVFRYQGTLIESSPASIMLEAIFDQPEQDLPDLALRKGDRFVEVHYRDRWYNVFAIFDGADGQLKGWYCNICRPAHFNGKHISAVDLALDLLVYPDGRWIVLDELEFEAQELSSQDRASARSALRELQALAAGMEGPFRKP